MCILNPLKPRTFVSFLLSTKIGIHELKHFHILCFMRSILFSFLIFVLFLLWMLFLILPEYFPADISFYTEASYE